MEKHTKEALKPTAIKPDFQLLRDKLAALPVHDIIDPVIRDVTAGLVTVVAASTSSGKTLILPSALADVSDYPIVVLVPRRFLAIDAAFNVAELAEVKIGDQVGYALGQMDGESALRSRDTKVLYCTNGYAISSGLIDKAQTIIVDEVHEADELISLVRAILRERKIAEPALRILELSATINAEMQARYWHPIAKTAVHSIEGKAVECDIVHESPFLVSNQERTIEDVVLDQLTQGRKGIALFRPGVREVEDSVATLKKQLAEMGINDVEVVGIHGGTPADERRIARRAPAPGKRKIIVGTNVIESGANLRWLDAGVSDGYCKVPHHRDDTGAEALVLEELPQSRLLQEIGRIGRDPGFTGFDRGLFILYARKPFDMRPVQNGPAIQRQSLNDIAFHAASLGYDPTQLTWDVTSTAQNASLQERMLQAKQELMRLHLIYDDWSLTKEGEFIEHLPVSPETGAMLIEAKNLDEKRMRSRQQPRVMRDIVIIAAIAESHGLRKDARLGHKGDQHRTSDLLDAMNAFRTIHKQPIAKTVLKATEADISRASEEELSLLKQQRVELEALCLQNNVSLTGFIEVAHLADEITNRLGRRDTGIRVNTREEKDVYDAERYGELQRCILNAHTNHLFISTEDGLRDLLRDYGNQRNDNGQPFNGYEISRSSIVTSGKQDTLMVGNLREVQDNTNEFFPKNVLTNVTIIPPNVFIAWAVERAADYQPIVTNGALEDGWLSGIYADKARFEIPISLPMRAEASHLVETEPSHPNGGRTRPVTCAH
jgi:HrpA-like RNA helicase